MSSFNANNYHWLEEDISPFCTKQLKALLSRKGYDLTDLVLTMHITVRMNEVGFIYDISCKMVRDGMCTNVKDFDNYSTVSDVDGTGRDDFVEALECVKKDAMVRYGGMVAGGKVEVEMLAAELVLDRAGCMDDNRSNCGGATEERADQHDECAESVQGRTIRMNVTVTCKKEDLLNYLFDPVFYRQYAPKSSRRCVRIIENVSFTNLDREKMTFNVVMPDLLPCSKVQLVLVEVDNGTEVRMEQNGVVSGNEDRIKAFWTGYFYPRLSMHFNCAVI